MYLVGEKRFTSGYADLASRRKRREVIVAALFAVRVLGNPAVGLGHLNS